MNRLQTFALTLTAAVLTTVTACTDRHDDFGQFAEVDPAGLAYGDTLAIEVSGLDTLPAQRRIRLGVRHSNDYEYRNVVLEITYRDGNKWRRDTVNMELADIYGAWLGTGIGPSYQQAVTVWENAAIPDSARITVRHVMRVDTLRGVNQIGIIIDKP